MQQRGGHQRRCRYLCRGVQHIRHAVRLVRGQFSPVGGGQQDTGQVGARLSSPRGHERVDERPELVGGRPARWVLQQCGRHRQGGSVAGRQPNVRWNAEQVGDELLRYVPGIFGQQIGAAPVGERRDVPPAGGRDGRAQPVNRAGARGRRHHPAQPGVLRRIRGQDVGLAIGGPRFARVVRVEAQPGVTKAAADQVVGVTNQTSPTPSGPGTLLTGASERNQARVGYGSASPPSLRLTARQSSAKSHRLLSVIVFPGCSISLRRRP